jgi:Arc/MetJ family transcription regulator
MVMYMAYAQHVHHHETESDMSLTQVDIDDEALREAMRLSGASTKKETVNLALREYAARHRRIAALEHFSALSRDWDYESWQKRRSAEKGDGE